MKPTRTILRCIIFLVLISGRAQGSSATFENLTTRDGLIQNEVRCLCQDRKGFIWIGTHDGLNRYDGKKFETFTHQSADPNSISDNYITKIFEDHSGNIWVGTRSGVNIYREAN